MTNIIKYLSVVLIAVLATLYLSKGCNVQPPEKDATDSLKTVINSHIKSQDSLKKLADRKDSVRIEYVLKWRTRTGGLISRIDSIPCDSMKPIIIELVASCDSIISADSSHIATLKNIISTDSLIISNQFKVIALDSVNIVGLKKELRKQKRHKKWLVAALAVVAGIAVVK